MDLECGHVMLNVSDLSASREFYCEKLEFEVIEDHQGMFAFRSGSVRFSVMGGGTRLDLESETGPNTTVMYRTADIEQTVSNLRAKGVEFLEDIQEAPGFMKHIALADPDNNLLFIAQYFRDPLQPA
ncbi:MAG: VOC family protein [Candidatus Kapaibacterium sp.]